MNGFVLGVFAFKYHVRSDLRPVTSSEPNDSKNTVLVKAEICFLLPNLTLTRTTLFNPS